VGVEHFLVVVAREGIVLLIQGFQVNGKLTTCCDFWLNFVGLRTRPTFHQDVAHWGATQDKVYHDFFWQSCVLV
jgi:hypothetical protein